MPPIQRHDSVRPATRRRIERSFRRSPTSAQDLAKCDLVAKQLRAVSLTLATIVPEGLELNNALKLLREAAWWATAGIVERATPEELAEAEAEKAERSRPSSE